jgi:hypothetical protein
MSDLFLDYDNALRHIAWMAQTLHQAYHQDIPGTWHDCPRDICASTTMFLSLPNKKEMIP